MWWGAAGMAAGFAISAVSEVRLDEDAGFTLFAHDGTAVQEVRLGSSEISLMMPVSRPSVWAAYALADSSRPLMMASALALRSAMSVVITAPAGRIADSYRDDWALVHDVLLSISGGAIRMLKSFAAFRISSTPIRTAMALRRVRAPNRPMENSAAEMIR